MKTRTDRDVIAIKRTIDQNYDKFKHIGVFYLEKNEVFRQILASSDEEVARIAAECREGGVRWRMFPKVLAQLEKALLGGAEIVDCSLSEEKGILTLGGVPAESFVRVIERPDGAAVSFQTTGVFDCLMKANRNGRFSVKGMTLTPDTEFTLVNELAPFFEDRYSIAFRSPAFSFALSAEDAKTGKKGSVTVKLYVLEGGRLTVDDLGKYVDTSSLLLWITA